MNFDCLNLLTIVNVFLVMYILYGKLKPIEELEVGEKIITRDKGVQEIRGIGQSTMRATGYFAPVVIKAGALNNMHDLVVSLEHRPFVCQRQPDRTVHFAFWRLRHDSA